MHATPVSAEGSAFHAAANYTPRRRIMALMAVALGFVMDLLDTTIVNVAVPSIKSALHAGTAALEWIIAGYAMAFAVLLIVGGRLGDSYGYRRIFLLGMALFTATSVLCGLAPDASVLAGARILQGASAALMVPQVMALVQVIYPPEQRYKVYAVFGFLGGFSAALGPIVGGLLIDADWFGLGWRVTFLINLPVGLLSFGAGLVLLPKGRGVNARPVDVTGALLSTVLLLAILLPLIEGPALDWPAWMLAVPLSALPLAWGLMRYLGWREKVHGDALVRPALLKVPRIHLGLLCSLCINPIIPGYLLVMTFVLQMGHGLTASQMAYACAPIAFGAMVGISLIGPPLHRWLGVRVLVAGIGTFTFSLALMGWVVNQPSLHWAALALAQFGMGIGLGLSGPPLSNVTLQDVPLSDAGAASGLVTAVQQVAGALGVALAGLLFFHGWDATAAAADLRYGTAYLQTLPLLLGLLAAGLWLALRLPRPETVQA